MKHFKKTTAVSVLAFLLIIMHPLLPAAAQEPPTQGTESRPVELVFLLDTSQSMEKTDPESNVPDLIRQVDLSLPENYRTGLVTYSTAVLKSIGTGQPGNIAENMGETAYEGYSNAGAGLSQAKELFTGDGASTKKILLVSDGEIDMPTGAETEEATKLFDQTLKELKDRGITVDILALGSLIPDAEAGGKEIPNILTAAEATGGKVYTIEDTAGLPAFAGTYLFDGCSVPAAMVGRLSGEEAELTVDLPDTLMDTARILLFGSQPGAKVNVIGRSERMQVRQGNGFTVVTLEKPMQTDFTLQITAGPEPDNSSLPGLDITAYLTAEYSVSLSAQNQYRPEDGAAHFELDITNGNGDSLLSGHLKGQKIAVWLDGAEQQAVKDGGLIKFNEAIAKSREVQIQAIIPQSYAVYHGGLAATDAVDVPPPPQPPEEPPRPDYFLIFAVVLLAISLLLLLIWAGKKRRRYPYRQSLNTVSRESLPAEPDAYGSDFCGKVGIYIVNSGDGIDYNPEAVNLAAKCSRDTITLQWLLDTCGLPLVLKDADRIIFRPGEGKSLLVKNSSRATALKGREVLAKFHSYHLHFREKVTFIFDHDVTAGGAPAEIEIHYKDLKINER